MYEFNLYGISYIIFILKKLINYKFKSYIIYYLNYDRFNFTNY